MRLSDCYRQLELEPGASLEEAKRAHLDLAKVWHPDRFANDAPLRMKAEEKLKLINEAYATIRDSGEEATDGGCRVRSRGREMRFVDVTSLVGIVDRGGLGGDAELFDPATEEWMRFSMIPFLHAPLANARYRRNRGWAISVATLAAFVLLRRPTPGGLMIALALLGVAAVLMFRAKTAE